MGPEIGGLQTVGWVPNVNDTSLEIEALYRKRLMALSGEDRFLRGVRMFDTARAMVLASGGAGMSDGEVRRLLLRRFYAGDLRPDELARAERALGL